MTVKSTTSESGNMPTITTQVDATPGNAYQRSASDSSVPSTSRASTPETHLGSGSNSNPPSYNLSPGKKEDLISQSQHTDGHQFKAYPNHQAFMGVPYSNDGFDLSHDFERCYLLPTLPAVWLLKGKDFRLSSLAATILLDDRLISSKELTLYVHFHRIFIPKFKLNPN